MKRAIEILSVPDGYTPFKLEIRDPGVVRGVVTGYEAPSIVAPADGGKPPELLMRPKPSIMFEVDPDAKPRTRHFVWLVAGKMVTYPGQLVFRGTYVDEPTGMPALLYETISK